MTSLNDARKRGSKGWYENGKVYLVLPNATGVDDAVETVLHEVVGHKGLRKKLSDWMNAYYMENDVIGIHFYLYECILNLRFCYLENCFDIQNIVFIFALLINNAIAMRIFTEQALKEYAENHPDSRTALQEWAAIVKRSEWRCFADVKATFNSVDNVGNQHYVFNIKGNNYRLVVVIKFTIKFVYVRFIGTHKEYDKIDCSTI